MKRRKGFTQVELLVAVAILLIPAALLMPAPGAARKAAMTASCASNQRQMGIGFGISAMNTGKLCSGAFDRKRDGRADEVGWVADLINNGLCNPGDMLCPASPCIIPGKWNDICEVSTTSTTVSDGQLPNPPAPVALDGATDIYKAGYNTNYATSWHMVRSALKPGAYSSSCSNWCLQEDPAFDITTTTYGAYIKPKGLHYTLGGLSRGVPDSARGTALDRIPLLGDGNHGDFGEATMSYELGYDRDGDLVADDDIQWTGGTVVCESFSDGPIEFPTEFTGYDGGAGGPWYTLGQDFVDFSPHHGAGSKKQCNILFGDGHVSAIADINGDTITVCTGDPAEPGDLNELAGIYYGSLIGAPPSGKL
jgi:prepilin-type processing-associated H-X9-DG protein